MEDMKWDHGRRRRRYRCDAPAGRPQGTGQRGGHLCSGREHARRNATRPGDVVKSMSGQTVEVITPVRGRLILCDAMWYARRSQAAAMVELSTLTAPSSWHLSRACGLFSNNTQLSNKLRAAGAGIGENCGAAAWAEYDKMIDSDIADMRTSPTAAMPARSRRRSSCSLRAGGRRLGHLDIAGMAWSNRRQHGPPKGATAYGVRLLDSWIAENYER